MKTKLKILNLILLCIFLTSCSSDDDSSGGNNPVNQLPEATQIGENTFGCLLDGEAFIPSGGTNPLDCVYQFVDGGYYFSLQGNRRDDDNNLERISLSTNAKELQEGQTYQLLTKDAGNVFGAFFFECYSNIYRRRRKYRRIKNYSP